MGEGFSVNLELEIRAGLMVVMVGTKVAKSGKLLVAANRTPPDC